MSKSHAKSGASPEKLRIEGSWQHAVKRAIEKPKPEGGWPERPKRKRTQKKKR